MSLPRNNHDGSLLSTEGNDLDLAQADQKLADAKAAEAAAREVLQMEIKRAQAEKEEAEVELRNALSERDKAQESYFNSLKEDEQRGKNDAQTLREDQVENRQPLLEERIEDFKKSEIIELENVTASEQEGNTKEGEDHFQSGEYHNSTETRLSEQAPKSANDANSRQDRWRPSELSDSTTQKHEVSTEAEGNAARLEKAEQKVTAAYNSSTEVQETTSLRVLDAAERLEVAIEQRTRAEEALTEQGRTTSVSRAGEPSSSTATGDPARETAFQSAKTNDATNPVGAIASPPTQVPTTAKVVAPTHQADPVIQPDQLISITIDKSASDAGTQVAATTGVADRVDASEPLFTPDGTTVHEGRAPTPQVDPIVDPGQPSSAGMNGSANEAGSQAEVTTQTVDSLDVAQPVTPALTTAEEGASTAQSDPVAEPSQPISATTDGSSIEADLQTIDTAGAAASVETSSSLPASSSTTPQTEKHSPRPAETEGGELGAVEQQNEPDAAMFSALAQDRAAVGDAENATLCDAVAADMSSISPDAKIFEEIADAKAAAGDITGADLCIAFRDEVGEGTDNVERSSSSDDAVPNSEASQRSYDGNWFGTSDLHLTFDAEERSSEGARKEGESEWGKEMTDSRSALYEAFRDAAYEGLKSAELGPGIGQAGL